MKSIDPTTCRSCGTTPERRGDAVSPAAIAYTCSRCLLTGYKRPEPVSGVTNTGIAGSPSDPPPAHTSPVDLDRVSSPGSSRDEQAWRQARGGRPRKHTNARDRQRAYRSRQQAALMSPTPAPSA